MRTLRSPSVPAGSANTIRTLKWTRRGVKNNNSFGPITAATVGRLEWNDLQIGTDASGPETVAGSDGPAGGRRGQRHGNGRRNRKVLVLPRRWARGFGPAARWTDAHELLTITADFPVVEQSREIDFVVLAMWLVEIREDKMLSFGELERRAPLTRREISP